MKPNLRHKAVWLNAFLLFVLCLALVGCQNAPSTAAAAAKVAEDSAPVLLPVKVSGKWGYVNSTGQLVINPQFDRAEEFHEGRAAVCVGGEPCDWGYIDTSGKLIVAPQYTLVSSFSEGLASVGTGDYVKTSSSGYIDRDGKLVISMQFGSTWDFKEGLARVCISKCASEFDKDRVRYEFIGKFGFIDHFGHFVINPQYDGAGDFKNGFAKVTVGNGDAAKTGYIDKTGKIIWQPSN